MEQISRNRADELKKALREMFTTAMNVPAIAVVLEDRVCLIAPFLKELLAFEWKERATFAYEKSASAGQGGSVLHYKKFSETASGLRCRCSLAFFWDILRPRQIHLHPLLISA